MNEPNKTASRTAVLITAIICGTLLLGGGIGALVYMNQQNLTQQKQLKEADIKAENDRAAKQRQLDNEKSQRDCRAQASYTFKCL